MTDWARAVLQRLLATRFHGSDKLAVQAESVEVVREDLGEGSLSLVLAVSPEAPRADVAARVPVEAIAPDTDGRLIHIFLHVVGGVLHELEVIRLDGERIQQLPSPEGLTVEKPS